MISPFEDECTKEVAKLILNGESNKDIAYTLTLSLSTVKVHASRVYQKVGVSSRVQLFKHFNNQQC
ncbi:MAG: response regulator transcription factor [Spirochaetales bacterium]|nr:response regulator transcription factor [Spirochaetales bacterium]